MWSLAEQEITSLDSKRTTQKTQVSLEGRRVSVYLQKRFISDFCFAKTICSLFCINRASHLSPDMLFLYASQISVLLQPLPPDVLGTFFYVFRRGEKRRRRKKPFLCFFLPVISTLFLPPPLSHTHPFFQSLPKQLFEKSGEHQGHG